MTEQWSHVAEQLIDRIDDLAVSEVAERAGIDVSVLTGYLAGEPIMSATERRRLLNTLDWPEDAIDRLLAGEFATDI